MDELFDIFDEQGNHIGTALRSRCHGDPSLIHRTAHVVVIHPESGDILLQKRTMTKDIQPGKWDTAVGGHVDAGESVEEAAYRELREELGITGSLEFFFTSTIRNNIESENVTVFKLVSDGPFEFSREEIDEIRFWELEAFTVSSARMRDDFTPNLQIELAEICKLVLKQSVENA